MAAHLLRHVADDADILVQAVADLLDRLQLRGVGGLGALQLAGKLADIAHLLPQILDLSLKLKKLIHFLFLLARFRQ